jgi:hypothetical protein
MIQCGIDVTTLEYKDFTSADYNLRMLEPEQVVLLGASSSSSLRRACSSTLNVFFTLSALRSSLAGRGEAEHRLIALQAARPC